ncbi:MAG TPA: PAS domain S-box protein [Coriobacteriia bacterium]
MSFFEVNMDYTYLISGLVFVSLAAVANVLSLQRDRSLPWWGLTAYGLGSSIALWGTMVAHDLGDSPRFAWARLAMHAIAFLFLFEFGRRGLRRRHRHVPGLWLTLAASAAVLASAIVGGIDAAERVAHLAILLPAGIGTFLAMASAARRPGTVGGRFLLAGGAVLGSYAVVAGSAGTSATAWGCSSAAMIAGLLPVQLVYAAATAAGGTLLLAYSSRRALVLDPTLDPRRAYSRLWMVPTMVALVLIGGYFVTAATEQADASARRVLLEQAQTAALSIDGELVRGLSADPSDAGSGAFAAVQAELDAIRRADPEMHLVFLTRVVGGTPRFLVESHAQGLDGTSAPGDEVLGGSPASDRLAAGSGEAVVEGPFTDPRGTWIAALVPLRDSGGTFVGLLSMNVPWDQWAHGPAQSRIVVILLVIVMAVIAQGVVAGMYLSRDAGRRTRASEARLRAILGSSPEGIAIIEPGPLTVLFANRALGEMLGSTGDDLRGARMTTFFAGGETDVPIALEGDDATVQQRQMVARDGRQREVEITYLPIDLDEGRKRLMYVHDITAQKAAERELRDRIGFENIVRAVSSRFLSAQASDVGLVVEEALATLGTFLQVDRVYLGSCTRDRVAAREQEWCAPDVPPLRSGLQNVRMDDYPWFYGQLEANDPVQIPSLDVLPPEAAAERAMLSSQGVHSRIAVPMTEDDRLVGYLTLDTVREERHWSGERIALLRVFGDVLAVATRRAKAENELAKLTIAVTNSPAATVITDVDGTIEYVNPRFSELSGYSAAELIGQNPRILKSEEVEASVYEELWRAISGGGDWRGELVNRRKDGTHYAVTASISPVRDSAGMVHHVCVQEDITALKLAEVALREAAETAQAANHAKSDFLATMSHEIRTPMNAIVGMAELLGETRLDEEQKRYVTIFRSAGESLLTLINDILDLSKIEAGRIEIESRDFRIEPLVRETAGILEVRAHEKGVELLIDIAPGTPDLMHGDPSRVRQVLLNLLGNAMKFTESGKVRLRVDTVDAGDVVTVRFAVTDSGIGVPQEKLETIFDAFTQADSSTTRRYGGTGLGLTISRRLVALMGGRLTAASEVGIGSTFSFTLPVSTALVVAATDAGSDHQLEAVPDTAVRAIQSPFVGLCDPPVVPQGPSVDTPSRAMDVLLVEDTDDSRMLALAYMKGQQHRIVTAENGQQAVAAYAAAGGRGFDVVLMDMQMPVMDGYAATRAIRELETASAWPRTPIVALTAFALAEEAGKASAAGCDDYLVKPIRKATLLAALARHMEAEETWREADCTTRR